MEKHNIRNVHDNAMWLPKILFNISKFWNVGLFFSFGFRFLKYSFFISQKLSNVFLKNVT